LNRHFGAWRKKDELPLPMMKVTRIDSKDGLDPITVFWQDFGVGQGSVTILCYDMAWTAWFGGMGGRSIEQFFTESDTDYTVTKLFYAQFLKNTAGHKKYLTRIVEAIKKEIAPY